MKKLRKLFQKAGGMDTLAQYARSHVLFFTLFQILLNGFSKKSLEIVRLAANNKRLAKLRAKYRKTIRTWQAKNPIEELPPRKRSNKVWVCWLQGIDHAPPLVQACYRSLQANLTDREIILLTQDNYKDYITFPAHVQEKIDNGIITRTHMSDLLRLELLCNYGGTWIDATVLCTGKVPEYMLDSDLFVFQNLKPGLDGDAIAISSWFMTGSTNHPILLLTRHLLYAYWQNHKNMVDYFLIHDFFQLAIETYPQLWDQVIPFSNATPHILLLRLLDEYDQTLWEAVAAQTAIHKLSYKFSQEQLNAPGSYYAHIIRQ